MKVGINLPAQFPFASTEELAGQFEGYAKNGLEHIVLANLTGVVGGMDEIMARGADLPQLMAALRDL